LGKTTLVKTSLKTRAFLWRYVPARHTGKWKWRFQVCFVCRYCMSMIN